MGSDKNTKETTTRQPSILADSEEETNRYKRVSVLADSEATSKKKRLKQQAEKRLKKAVTDLSTGAKTLEDVHAGDLKKLKTPFAEPFFFLESRKKKNEQLCPKGTTLQDLFQKEEFAAAREEYLSQVRAELGVKLEPTTRGKKNKAKGKRNGVTIKPKDDLKNGLVVMEELAALNKGGLALAREKSEKQLKQYLGMFMSSAMENDVSRTRVKKVPSSTTIAKLFANDASKNKAEFIKMLKDNSKDMPPVKAAYYRALLHDDLIQLDELVSHAKVAEFIVLFRSVMKTYYLSGAEKSVVPDMKVWDLLVAALKDMDRLEGML